MKILPKQEVTRLKAQERQVEITEGAKLAKKIDLLRKTYAEESVSLEKFHTESLKKIRQEIVEAIEERDRILKEVETLREERLKIKKLLEEIYEHSSTEKYNK